MASITIYVANLAGLSDDVMSVIRTTLSSYFSTVVYSTDSDLTGIRVVTTNTGVSPTNTDLLCYIVSDFAHSKVKLFNSSFTNTPGNAGNTAFTSSAPYRAASEVYSSVITSMATNQGLAFANLIFHELMHNKGTVGDELHNNGGYGLAAETVTEDSSLTDGNCTYLRGILDKEVAQFVTSF